MKLSVVIPCYNERQTIREIVSRVEHVRLPAEWEKEVIVVDDASTDGTREILSTLDPAVCVVLRATNGGKGTALCDGFAAATGTHVLIQDADLEYHPDDIPALLKKLNESGIDAVYGSRNLSFNHKGRLSWRLGTGFITTLVNLLYGQRLTDACTCYKLFPREAARLFVPGRFESDMLIGPALVRAGYRITEVPINHAPRTMAEGKKIRYTDGMRGIMAILTDWAKHLPRELLLPTVAVAATMAITYFVSGFFNDRIDTWLYVGQIEAFRAFFVDGTVLPALATFKPFPGIVGALMSYFMYPYTAIFLFNNLLFFGFIFAFYGFLRELAFSRFHAALGASWTALSYPILKYGLALGTDEWGWCIATLIAMLTLNAVRTKRRHFIVLASVIGFFGSLAKETAVLGLFFSGLYLLAHLQIWHVRETVRWLMALSLPFFTLQALLLSVIVWFGGPTFLDWYVANGTQFATLYTLTNFFGVMASTFNVLLVFVFVGFIAAWRSRDIFRVEWLRVYGPLALAIAPVLAWPIFISRILFIQILFMMPVALLGVRAIEPYVRGMHSTLVYVLYALPPLTAVALFLISGNGSLFEVLMRYI